MRLFEHILWIKWKFVFISCFFQSVFRMACWRGSAGWLWNQTEEEQEQEKKLLGSFILFWHQIDVIKIKEKTFCAHDLRPSKTKLPDLKLHSSGPRATGSDTAHENISGLMGRCSRLVPQPAGPRALWLTFTADSYFVYWCGDDEHRPETGESCSINNSAGWDRESEAGNVWQSGSKRAMSLTWENILFHEETASMNSNNFSGRYF